MTNEPTPPDTTKIRGLLRHYGGMMFGAGRCEHLRDDEVIVSMEVLGPMQAAARDAEKALAELDAALRAKANYLDSLAGRLSTGNVAHVRAALRGIAVDLRALAQQPEVVDGG